MDSLPWDAAGLGPLDFAEQLLVFTEDEPESAAADIERLKQERIEMQQLQVRLCGGQLLGEGVLVSGAFHVNGTFHFPLLFDSSTLRVVPSTPLYMISHAPT